MSKQILSTMEIDAIGEILNISLGASATAVSTMLDARVDITTPVVSVVKKEDFAFSNLKPAIGVEITYIEGLSGKNIMLLKRQDIKVIVEMLMGTTLSDDEFELNEMNISAICEVMNQMMGASATALSELFGTVVNISTPKSFEVESENHFKETYFTEDGPMVVIGFKLRIGDKMESEFLNLMSTDLAREIVSGFFTNDIESDMVEETPAPEQSPVEEEEVPVQAMQAEPAAAPAPQPAAEAVSPAMAQPAPSVQPANEGAVRVAAGGEGMLMEQMMQTMQAMQKMQEQMLGNMHQPRPERTISAKKKDLPPLRSGEYEEDPDANLDLLMGVPLELSVEIGRTKRQVKDILELNKGSLVVLDHIAGEPVDLFVNGECIAKGDVVVVEDNFAIRITEILHEEPEEE